MGCLYSQTSIISTKNDHQQKFRLSFDDFGGGEKFCADFLMVKFPGVKKVE
jgi:hypothetical protein